LAIIVVLGAVFASLAFIHPFGSPPWLWGFALLFYMPFVLLGAALVKFAVIQVRRFHR